MDKTPVYKFSEAYAQEHNELPQYNASFNTNVACARAIEAAIGKQYGDNILNSREAVQEVVKQFGYERTFYILAHTVQEKDWDGRISRGSKEWARTIPVEKDRRSGYFIVDKCNPGLTDLFLRKAVHEHLLSQPLKREDIKAEATHILEGFRAAQEPNSPNGTHFMVQVSPDFLARAKTKDHERLMNMLPFQSLSLSTLEGRKGTYALIRKEEDRSQKLCLRRPSVRKKLQEYADAPKPPSKGKAKQQE